MANGLESRSPLCPVSGTGRVIADAETRQALSRAGDEVERIGQVMPALALAGPVAPAAPASPQVDGAGHRLAVAGVNASAVRAGRAARAGARVMAGVIQVKAGWNLPPRCQIEAAMRQAGAPDRFGQPGVAVCVHRPLPFVASVRQNHEPRQVVHPGGRCGAARCQKAAVVALAEAAPKAAFYVVGFGSDAGHTQRPYLSPLTTGRR
jgi:hypothetical protein